MLNHSNRYILILIYPLFLKECQILRVSEHSDEYPANEKVDLTKKYNIEGVRVLWSR